MFSVVIPLYNKEQSIANTIQSVLDQTFQDFEIVVVNDGSTDKSAEIVERINGSRIRLIHQENGGVSSARNRGIKEAVRDWIAFLDGDDLWKVNHLEEVAEMIKLFPNDKVFTTSFEYSDGRKLFKHPRKSKIFKVENYFKEALKESLIWTSVVTVHKSCFDKVGAFNPKLSRGEDLDMWARLAREYDVVKSSEVTAVYRVEAENRSVVSFNLDKSRIYNYNFEDSTSDDETTYYKTQISNSLFSFAKKMDFKNFFKLKAKHKSHISYLDILKSKR